MAVYSMGTILKKCREMKKITQEELCYGICTASALSKMEHGVREPSYVKFASLMERMGEWPEAYDIFIGDKVYRINELQSKIGTWLYHLELGKAEEALGELEKELVNFPDETIYHQFWRMGKVICRTRGRFDIDSVKELIGILKWTVPGFGNKPIKEFFLSYQELVLINNIAIGYGDSKEIEKAISLLQELKEYLETTYMGNRNKTTMYSTVLLNLVKYLGLGGHYWEALEVADEAINILVENGKTLKIATLHYDIAWLYMKIDRVKYRQKIEDELILSLCADISNRNYHSADETYSLMKRNVPEILENPISCSIRALYHRMAPAHSPKQTE